MLKNFAANWKSGNRSIIFQKLFISFLVNRYNMSLFPIRRKLPLLQTIIQNYRQWFANSISTQFYYSYSEHIVTEALFGFKFFIILEMSFVEKFTESSDLLVSFSRLLYNALLLFSRVHRFAKKSSAFSLKFVINLFS